jgi:Transient receptor potential (TRP) ion channel/ML-like domain
VTNTDDLSLCPMNASVPIEASGIIPVAQSDVAGIPNIALSIPDFEGQAVLRIFANSTESQIACYSAVVTNGATFSHPTAVGSALGVFTAVALFSSMAVAMYGDHIDTTRQHYAHSLSILVVFSVFHHIYFTGALSMNWPSVLVAFWSNFAWSAGMIYSTNMQNSINQLIGSNRGNLSIVGSASAGENSENLGGGYQISDIYKRAIYNRDASGEVDFKNILRSRIYESAIAKRDLANSSSGFSWYGSPVKPGLPLPGNFSGFAGTLSPEKIPASNAFMTGFLWLLILMVIIAASVAALKWIIEGLSRIKVIKTQRLAYFRTHWIMYTILAVLRTCYIAFFMIMLLTMFQFTFKGSAGVMAIAGLVFVLFFVGMGAVTIYAYFYRLRFGRPDRLNIGSTTKLGFFPWISFMRESKRGEKDANRKFFTSLPWRQTDHEDADPAEEEAFLKKFGWLSARFRATRWWFFAPWLVYEFVRACFFGGAAGHAMTQVFGLLAVEFIALVGLVWMKPFEGARLNSLIVYFLGFSKVTTVALSSAFDLRFNLDRITTTVIGIVIIVIQGILTILLLIAIALGAFSSYMSVTRNREEFKPRSWTPLRKKYIARVENHPPEPVPEPPPPMPESPKEPYFSVNSVRRLPKIEDEDEDLVASRNKSKTSIVMDNTTKGASRAGSLRSQFSHSSLPYGAARPHRARASWSSADFANWLHENEQNQAGKGPLISISGGSLREGPSTRTRASSRAGDISWSGTQRTETPIETIREGERERGGSSNGKQKEM